METNVISYYALHHRYIVELTIPGRFDALNPGFGKLSRPIGAPGAPQPPVNTCI